MGRTGRRRAEGVPQLRAARQRDRPGHRGRHRRARSGRRSTASSRTCFTPLIAAIFGKADFATLTFTINNSVFYYGAFLNALISFVCIAFAVFFFVVKPQSVLRQRLGYDPPEEPQTAACPRCTTDIPVAATRCPSCTSELEVNWSTAA